MKIINEIFLASELAQSATVNELVGVNSKYKTEDDIWEYDKLNEIDVYKEDVQVVFSRWYDYFISVIDNCSEEK